MLAATAVVVAGGCTHVGRFGSATTTPTTRSVADVPRDQRIIDIHQHTTYQKRSDQALFHHQKRMGATQTILLPSGSPIDSPATLKGKANGLYAGAGGMSTVVPIAREKKGEYFFFANEVPDLPNARQTLESWLKQGALGIGEQKFNVPCDGPEMAMVYDVAQEFRVPVLMPCQYAMFNTGS